MKPSGTTKLTLIITTLLLSSLTCVFTAPVKAQEQKATMKIINPLTGENKFLLNTTEYPVNSTFTVEFHIQNVTAMTSWQIAISWNNTIINFKKAWLPDDNVFASAHEESGADYLKVPAIPDIKIDKAYLIYAGGLLPKVPVDVPETGLLCRMNFTVATHPEDSQLVTNIELIPIIDPQSLSYDTFVILKTVRQPIPVYAEPAIVRILKEEIVITQELAIASLAVDPGTFTPSTSVTISIQIQNLGNDAEAFNVTIKYNKTLIAQFRLVLGASQNITHEFEWNTTGVPVETPVMGTFFGIPIEMTHQGIFVLSADLTILPKETVTTNNHAETIISTQEQMNGLGYMRWYILTALMSSLGQLAVAYTSAFIVLLAILWWFRRPKSNLLKRK